MPRFTDKWVLDKCMFDYVQGGSCACCGFTHLFNPGGIEGVSRVKISSYQFFFVHMICHSTFISIILLVDDQCNVRS